MELNKKATREEEQNFLSLIIDSGDGSGYGSGAGFSSRDGYGRGSISSGAGNSSDGNGNGFGSGDGDIGGIGRGYGCGCGVGQGNGFGNGNGQSYYNIQVLNGYSVDYIDNVPTIIIQVRGNIACGYIIKEDFTLEPCYIAKVGYSFAHGVTLKDAIADAEAKEMERIPIEERIEKFKEVFGSLDSEHTGKEFYDWHHILTGSCRMGRDKFCEDNSINLEKKYTVKYFLDITENSYGGDVIKLIEEAYKEI